MSFGKKIVLKKRIPVEGILFFKLIFIYL